MSGLDPLDQVQSMVHRAGGHWEETLVHGLNPRTIHLILTVNLTFKHYEPTCHTLSCQLTTLLIMV